MQVRTLLAITLTMFAVPALSTRGAETPLGPPLMLPPTAGAAVDATGSPDTSVVFEVRTLKVPAGFSERAGWKPTGNVVLDEIELRAILEGAQMCPTASIMQFPKVTADSGQTATVRNSEQRVFVTGVDAKRVKGQTVLVPRNMLVELGDVLTVCGTPSRDAQAVTIKVNLTRTRLASEVELIPVTTQITPVFEGGSQGKPVPFTQFIQSPDVRTESVEKSVIITSGQSIVLGSWKEAAEPVKQPAGPKWLPRKDKAPAEFEVVTIATARVIRSEEPAVAPMPHAAAKVQSYPLRNVAAADAASAIGEYLKDKNLDARVTFDAITNSVFISADAPVMQRLRVILNALDKAPAQVIVQAMVVKVPRGFVSQSGLNVGGTATDRVWTLSPREAQMLTNLFRAEKERGGFEVLSRPQMCVADGQTAVVQVGQSFPVVEEGAGGRESLRLVPTGLAIRVTAKIHPDGKKVTLDTDAQFTEVKGTTANAKPVFSTQSLRAAADLQLGHTLVLACSESGNAGGSFLGAIRSHSGDDSQTLVILTPTIAAAPEPVRPAAGWFVK